MPGRTRATPTPTATATVTVDGTSVGAVQLVGRSNFESFLRASGTELQLVDRGCGAENLDLTFRPRSRTQPVTIEDVTFDGPDAFGFSPPELPLELGKGQYYLPEFRYASGLDTHRGRLTVRAISGGYSETHVVDVEGRYELEEIEGTQTSTALRDIMLVTDDLDPIHIDRLLEGVDALLDELERFDVDYQVGVIDTHDDRPVPSRGRRDLPVHAAASAHVSRVARRPDPTGPQRYGPRRHVRRHGRRAGLHAAALDLQRAIPTPDGSHPLPRLGLLRERRG